MAPTKRLLEKLVSVMLNDRRLLMFHCLHINAIGCVICLCYVNLPTIERNIAYEIKRKQCKCVFIKEKEQHVLTCLAFLYNVLLCSTDYQLRASCLGVNISLFQEM